MFRGYGFIPTVQDYICSRSNGEDEKMPFHSWIGGLPRKMWYIEFEEKLK